MFGSLRVRAAVSAAVIALLGAVTASASGQSEAETLSATFRKAAKRVLPAVVSIRTPGAPGAFPILPNPEFPEFGPEQLPPDRAFPGLGLPRPTTGGSGVIIDSQKGYVLTTNHVVEGGGQVAVILHDGQERIATTVRRDPRSDLALLIIDAKDLPQAEWGESDTLDMGDWVLAIGHPLGLSDTVTAGIVSGKGRGVGLAMYEDLIQTDAVINPGNSGGPLVNMKGELVGINTAIKTRHGAFDGVGFAIPASRARRVARELAEHGHVRRAYLGVQVGPVDRATAKRLGQRGAVRINGVSPGSPAAEAGLRTGDIVLNLQDKPVTGVSNLQTVIEVAKIGAPLSVTIDREGERREIQVSPREQPEAFGVPPDEPAFPRPRRLPRGPRSREPELKPPAEAPGEPPGEIQSTPRPETPTPG